FNNTTTDFFPTISITGEKCALNCKHCQGKILQTMNQATSAEELYRLCCRLKQKGAKGCLISGGCTIDGSVPIEDFIATIAKIKRDLEFVILVHTGLLSFDCAKQLKKAKVDCVLIDVIGKDDTIQQIYNLKATTLDYENSLLALENANLDFVPHVVVGLDYGKLGGEFEALKIIKKHTPAAVVIIGFMPIPRTQMAKTKPPKPIDIARTIATARILLPNIPLALGCMRAKGRQREEIDVLALKAGANAIAFPTQTTIDYAKKNSYKTFFSTFCCAQIYKDFDQ
ncbi:MAG: radical SAM protein, partial [Bacteroidales bacterium]|nr:radical SAM protein [Bacteroidales bacterium]